MWIKTLKWKCRGCKSSEIWQVLTIICQCICWCKCRSIFLLQLFPAMFLIHCIFGKVHHITGTCTFSNKDTFKTTETSIFSAGRILLSSQDFIWLKGKQDIGMIVTGRWEAITISYHCPFQMSSPRLLLSTLSLNLRKENNK